VGQNGLKNHKDATSMEIPPEDDYLQNMDKRMPELHPPRD
jgi:hypothetical protein